MKLVSCADAAVLARVHAGAMGEAWSEADFAALLAGSGVCALAAVGDVDPIGFVLWRTAGEEAEVLTLATTPAHRRLGVATAMVCGAIAAAAAAGAQTLFLEVAEENLPALALYARLGFAMVGRRRGYYVKGADRTDALVLRRELNTTSDEPYA
jgi:ribosomal-protein-alanine N-acetyltransferase